ncbi:hypothetical protein P0Y35_00260 [Kiritimatiellaeota bacterium B1221]|nr:hypothetical protein [Kiritimatiellaeota bacterium B1221]
MLMLGGSPLFAQVLVDLDAVSFSSAETGIWGNSNTDGITYEFFQGFEEISVSTSFGGFTGSQNATIIPRVCIPFVGCTPAVRADTRTGLKVDFSAEMTAGLRTYFHLDAGTANASVSYDPNIYVPEMRIGVHNNLTTSNGLTGSPVFETSFTGLDVESNLEMNASASIEASYGLIGLGVDTITESLDLSYTAPNIFSYNIYGEDPNHLAVFGDTFVSPVPVDGTAVRIPPTSPVFDYGSITPYNPVIETTTSTTNEDGSMSTSGSAQLMDIRGDIDAMATQLVIGAPYGLGVGYDVDIHGVNVASIAVDLLNIEYGPSFGMSQDFQFTPGLEAELTFSRPVSILENGVESEVTRWKGLWEALPEIAMLDATQVDVDVMFSLLAEVRNQTFLTVEDELAVQLLQFSASMLGIGEFSAALFDESTSLFSHPDIAGVGSLKVFDDTFTLSGLSSFSGGSFSLEVALSDVSWAGAGTGYWDTAANWSNLPVATSKPGETNNVFMGGTTAVTLRGHEAVANLFMPGTASLEIDRDSSLTLSQSILGLGGEIHLDTSGTGSDPELLFNTDTTVSGGGAIRVSGGSQAFVGAGPTAVNGDLLTLGANTLLDVDDSSLGLGYASAGGNRLSLLQLGNLMGTGSGSFVTADVVSYIHQGETQLSDGAQMYITTGNMTAGTALDQNNGTFLLDDATLGFLDVNMTSASISDDRMDGQMTAANDSVISLYNSAIYYTNLSLTDSSLSIDADSVLGANAHRTQIDLVNSTADIAGTLQAHVSVDADSELHFTGSNLNIGIFLENAGEISVNNGTTTLSEFVPLVFPYQRPDVLNNQGTLTVTDAHLDVTMNVANVVGGELDILDGGTWNLVSDSGTAQITMNPNRVVWTESEIFGDIQTEYNGALRLNRANVSYAGETIVWDYFSTLSENEGSFSLSNHDFTTAGDLRNRGVLSVSDGGMLAVNGTFTQTEGDSVFEDTSIFNTNGNRVEISGGTLTAGDLVIVTDLSEGGFTGNWRVSSSGGNATVVDWGTQEIQTNMGTLEVAGENTTFEAYKSLSDNQGTFRVEGGSFVLDGALTNSGTLEIVNGASLETGGDFTQTAGHFEVGGSSSFFINGDYIHSGGTSQIDGIFTVAGTSSTDAFGDRDITLATYTVSDGDLSGSGNLIGNLSQSGGTISPGNSPGTLVVYGDYEATGGVLNMELNRLENGQVAYDQLDVWGNVTLTDVDLNLIPTFLSAPGYMEIMLINVGGTLTGTFNGLAQGATVTTVDDVDLLIDYAGGDGNDVMIYAVPELSSLALFFGAMVTCFFFARRRKRG